MSFRRTLSVLTNAMDRPFKVLFCGHHFPETFSLGKEALVKYGHNNIIMKQCSREDLRTEIVDADVVVPLMTKIGAREIEAGKNLKMIMQYFVGLEGVDVPKATAENIWVCHTTSEATGNAQSVAEHAIFLAISLMRNTTAMKQSLLTGQLGYPMGKTFYKSTAIIYGYGGLGYQIKHRLEAFGMNLIVVSDDHPELHGCVERPHEEFPGVTYIKVSEMATTPGVKEADVVFLCCAQNAENMGFVNNQFISQLKPGAFLVNIARGGLLNYRDVQDALDSGALGGVGLDVYHTEPFPLNDPFLTHPKVVATPHIAGITEYSLHSMAEQFALNIDYLLKGENPIGNVNTVSTRTANTISSNNNSSNNNTDTIIITATTATTTAKDDTEVYESN